MPQDIPNLSNLEYIIGDAKTLGNMPDLPPLPPFSDIALDFFSKLSKVLLNTGRAYSDVVTFAFWCRRAALTHESQKYDDLDKRLGKGIVFHSTPSNVAVNFAFSFAAGLLAGNANIVRLPARDFPQVKIICQAIREVLNSTQATSLIPVSQTTSPCSTLSMQSANASTSPYSLTPYICMVKYAPDRAISDLLSSMCNVRVIWGGDSTIDEIRQSPIPPRSTEITFADRYSIAVIDVASYLSAASNPQTMAKIAQDFYNDTYFSDQNACTAPRIVFWRIADISSETDRAKALFWDSVISLAREKYTLTPVQSVGKLHAMYRAAAAKNLTVTTPGANDMYAVRLQLSDPSDISEDLMQYRYHSGFFFEADIASLSEILPICGLRCQTLIHYGLQNDDLSAFLALGPKGIDRAVPMGHSMDFTLVWDGTDLIRAMSRKMLW